MLRALELQHNRKRSTTAASITLIFSNFRIYLYGHFMRRLQKNTQCKCTHGTLRHTATFQNTFSNQIPLLCQTIFFSPCSVTAAILHRFRIRNCVTSDVCVSACLLRVHTRATMRIACHALISKRIVTILSIYMLLFFFATKK